MIRRKYDGKFENLMGEFPNENNLAEFIMDFEDDRLSWLDTLNLFSYLVKTGMAWTLQGRYGRCAMSLIEEGFLSKEGDILKSQI